MTIKEMLEKVRGYNEIAELVGGEKVKLMIQFGSFYWSQHEIEDLASFRKWIRHEYVDGIASKILNGKEYEFDKKTTVSWVDKFGETLNETVEFYVAWR